MHGSGGNLAELPLRAVARALSPRGYAALTISTRQHDEHVNTDNFFDLRKDIEAAVATVKATRLHVNRACGAQSWYDPGGVLRSISGCVLSVNTCPAALGGC